MSSDTATPPPSPAYVLYIEPGKEPSDRLTTGVQNSGLTQIYIQDVRLLPQRPSWLNGTPILADTKMGLIYRGTDAFVFAQKLKPPISSPSIQEPTLVPNTEEDPVATSAMSSLFTEPDLEDLPVTESITDSSRQESFNATDIQELMRQRQTQITSKHKGSVGKKGELPLPT